MGCGSSNTATKAIVAFGSPKKLNRPVSAPTDHSSNLAGASNAKSKKPSSAASKKNQRPESGGTVSVSAVVAFRNGSAASDRSVDSGIGNDSRDGSAGLDRAGLPPPGPRFAQQLPPDLTVLKKADRARPRVDEESILASLRQEGLLGAPNTSTTKGGLSFEVPAEELKVRSRRPPPRLQRLEPSQRQEGNVINDRIRQKLATAETRRKKRENDKVQRNREKDAKILETKLASLDIEGNLSENSEPMPKSSQDRIVSARHRRRPISAVVVPPPSTEEVDVMTPKASPLVIDDLPVGAGAKQHFF